MTKSFVPVPHGAMQVPTRSDSLRHYFEGQLVAARKKADAAYYVSERDDALARITHYTRMTQILEGRA